MEKSPTGQNGAVQYEEDGGADKRDDDGDDDEDCKLLQVQKHIQRLKCVIEDE